MTIELSAREVRRGGRAPVVPARAIACTLALVMPSLALPAAARTSYDNPWEATPGSFPVARTDLQITVDGALDEPAWAEALVLNLDYEVQPGDNIPPPVRTELRVSYDDEHVYFGFRAFDPDPDRIRARYSDRDEAWSDDWVGVAIDTFNDQRRAYELLSNPLGVQMDAINDDVLSNYDDSWNAIWDSAGRITGAGYEVEMKVPFSQLRFAGDDGQRKTWGFDAFRSYPRSDRHHIGLFPRDRGNNSYLSQTVKLIGLEEADPGSNLEIIPTLTATRVDARIDTPQSEWQSGSVDPELGATVRWGMTPNMSLNGAVNPDFSQVEADVLQLSINEQFDLFYPETRPFFLEGADYFNTPINLVHTRVVLDPAFAAKITGKNGRNTYGLFSAQDEITTVVFPGAESSSSETFPTRTQDTAGRYRFDFGRNSTAGVTYTDRRADDGYSNQVASLDTTLRFSEADRITASVGGSRTRYSEEMVATAGVSGDTFSDTLLRVNYGHTERNWWVDATHSDFGDGFRADLGYLPQIDFVENALTGARIWWGEEGDFHRRLAWGGLVAQRDRQAGGLLDERIETWVNLNGPRQSYMSIVLNMQNRVYEQAEFDDQQFAHTVFEIQAAEDLKLIFHQDYGDWIDFDNVRPATRTLVQPGLTWNGGRHFKLQVNHTYSALDVAGGRLFTVQAPDVRFIYQFNTRAFVRAILQYTDIERDPALYLDPVEPREQDLLTQFLFAYKVNPATAFYFGYADAHEGAEDLPLTQTTRSLFIKLGYAWMP